MVSLVSQVPHCSKPLLVPTNYNANPPENNGNNAEQNETPSTARLQVAIKEQLAEDLEAFYVTPFIPEQTMEDVMQHICDISGCDPDQVTVTKLVPRGKQLSDLSFVSFKIVVPKAESRVIGNAWYWPDGINVRVFKHHSKNEPAAFQRTQT